MNYEERYNELIDAIKVMQEANPHDEGLQNWVQDNVPELAESEDERIRKRLIENFKWFCGDFPETTKLGKDDDMLVKDIVAWLEKQVSIDKEKMLIGARKDVASSIITYLDRNTLGMCLSNMECEDLVNAVVDSDWSKVYGYMKKKLEKQDESKVSEPNWCHHKVDLSAYSEEYRKAYYDGWNNCNMQHSQCNEERNDVVKCLINGMKFYYEDNEDATWGTDKWSMPVKHIIEVLEKQGEHKSGWSEEDEKNLQGIIDKIEANKNEAPSYDLPAYDKYLNWLKSLKNKIKNE